MKMLNDQDLLATYKLAVEMKLSPDFIKMLLDEIKRRQLSPPEQLKESLEKYTVRRRLAAINSF